MPPLRQQHQEQEDRGEDGRQDTRYAAAESSSQDEDASRHMVNNTNGGNSGSSQGEHQAMVSFCQQDHNPNVFVGSHHLLPPQLTDAAAEISACSLTTVVSIIDSVLDLLARDTMDEDDTRSP